MITKYALVVVLSISGSLLGQGDYDSLNEIDLGPPRSPGQHGIAGQLPPCGKCIKEQCVSPENCLAGEFYQFNCLITCQND